MQGKTCEPAQFGTQEITEVILGLQELKGTESSSLPGLLGQHQGRTPGTPGAHGFPAAKATSLKLSLSHGGVRASLRLCVRLGCSGSL